MSANFEHVTNRLFKKNTVVNYLFFLMNGMLYNISCAHDNLLLAFKFRSATLQKFLCVIHLLSNLLFQRFFNYFFRSILTLSGTYIFTFEKLIKALNKLCFIDPFLKPYEHLSFANRNTCVKLHH